jgi:hypothetical protein
MSDEIIYCGYDTNAPIGERIFFYRNTEGGGKQMLTKGEILKLDDRVVENCERVLRKDVTAAVEALRDSRTTANLARKFHETYERLAPEFGYETRTETREFDPESPNGQLMIAVIEELGY